MPPRLDATGRLLFVLAAAAVLAGAARAGGIQRLAYNNEQLVVDLGVGLWAWPLPLDYDGDGDLDLLVACPDTPSNGVYLFENADGQVKMPLFKPAVRLGRAHRYMQISSVNGQPRILVPGHEFVDFRQRGFGKATRIYSKDNIHGRAVRANQWSLVDYDGDGAHDLVVGVGDWSGYGWDNATNARGRWQNDRLHGYVYLLRNTGTDNQPEYAPKKRVQAGGADVDVYGWPSPCFADFDGDGDLDLLCGEFLDTFTYFENIGSRTAPRYATGKRLRHNGRPLRMDLQMITPVAIDWDRDGDVDLVVGQEDGRVALVEHTGQVVGGVPCFLPPVFFQQQADRVKFGALATPAACDWDGDGDQDILCGNTAGYIGWFENLGGGAAPKWAAAKLLEAGGRTIRIQAGPNGSVQGPCEAKWGYTTLSVADWDGDDLPDLVVNSIWGEVLWYRNVGTRTEPRLAAARPIEVAWPGAVPKPRWQWWDPGGRQLVTQWRTTPVAVDFTGDGLVDLVLLDHEGYLTLLERRLRDGRRELLPPNRIFVDPSGQPIRLNPATAGGSGRRKIAVVDWDGDGRLDVLVDSANADWWRNCGRRDGKTVLHRVGPLARKSLAAHSTCPTVVDWNRDGRPDLLLGAEDGYLYHLAHEDAVAYAEDDLSAAAPPPPAAADQAAPSGKALNDSGSRMRENSGRLQDPPKSHDFGHGQNLAISSQKNRSRRSPPGLVQAEFVFTKAPFAECHASTIAQTRTGFVVAWFGGTEEGADDVGIWVSRFDGRRWTGPREVANGVQYAGKRYACWNPVLFQPRGGPLLLFYKVGATVPQWWGMLTTSHDGGRVWTEPRRLPEGILGPVKNKPIELADGTLLCGSSTEHDGWRVHFEMTGDLGQSWSRTGPINDKVRFHAIQPCFLVHADGRLQVLCRTRQDRLATASSTDGGRTWTEMTATGLPNPNAGTDSVTLADGRHLLVYNHTLRGRGSPRDRNMLNVAVSRDGVDWQAALVLENEPGEFSYPAVMQADDGLVHITYTWKRQRIKHVVLDPSALVLQNMPAGKWPGLDGREPAE